MSLRQNTTERVNIILLDPTTGNRVTNISVASNKIANNTAYLIKSDGTTSTITLVQNSTWFEIDSTNNPGVYQLVINSSHLNLLGYIAWTIRPSGSDFNIVSGSDTITSLMADVASIQADTNDIQTRLPAALVSGKMDSSISTLADNTITAAVLASDVGTEIATAVWSNGTRTLSAATNITSTGGTTVPQTGDAYARLGAPTGASVSADIAAVKTKTDTLPSDPASVTSVNSAKTAIMGPQTLSISTIAGGALFDQPSDNLHRISTALVPGQASMATQVWDELRSNHTAPGTYGEFVRTLYLIFTGRSKIDRASHKLIIYAEDGITPFKLFDLKDIAGQPADTAAAERIPV